MINNFTINKILNVYIAISSNSYRDNISNNFKKLIKEKKGLSINSIITTLILTITSIYIRLTKFLKANAPKMAFDIDKKILEKLLIIKNFLQS